MKSRATYIDVPLELTEIVDRVPLGRLEDVSRAERTRLKAIFSDRAATAAAAQVETPKRTAATKSLATGRKPHRQMVKRPAPPLTIREERSGWSVLRGPKRLVAFVDTLDQARTVSARYAKSARVRRLDEPPETISLRPEQQTRKRKLKAQRHATTGSYRPKANHPLGKEATSKVARTTTPKSKRH